MMEYAICLVAVLGQIIFVCVEIRTKELTVKLPLPVRTMCLVNVTLSLIPNPRLSLYNGPIPYANHYSKQQMTPEK